jgi:hypothetical protein
MGKVEPEEREKARAPAPYPAAGGHPAEPPAAATVAKKVPDFQPSGALAADAAMRAAEKATQAAAAGFDGAASAEAQLRALLKFSEPPDARVPATEDPRDGAPAGSAAAAAVAAAALPGLLGAKPDDGSGWRLYAFKDSDVCVGPIAPGANGRSWVLIGRDAEVCDVVAAHPSISAQHAVIQFRAPEGTSDVLPYLMDLSRKGTMLNGARVKRARYTELRDGDKFQLGKSTREYVFIRDPEAKAKE